MDQVVVNGRAYRRPTRPVVVVCVDGSEPGYIERAVETGRARFFERVLEHGTNRLADCVIPSFTNPNNISIVTGVPPSVHGISGNFFFDPESGAEVMMNDPRLMRADTVFKAFQGAGARIAVITAKDKLRRLLGHGLAIGPERAICFSAEQADTASLAEHGVAGVTELVGMGQPDVYSAELSEFVLRAGVAVMERDAPDIMYLSTTDYIQHKHAPGTPVANAFYAMMDRYLGELDAMGVLIALTADHGMNAKHDATGAPDVIYLQDLLDRWLGAGTARVILPITDPYVVHHGALGSFATVYLAPSGAVPPLIERLRGVTGIELALTRTDACARFELPEDRVGDVVVLAATHKVLGTSRARHDLSGLTEPLRSHGGLSEQRVPLLVNRPTALTGGGRLRNFDAFDLALNRAVD